MRAFVVRWSTPFSPATDYLKPLEGSGIAVFTTQDLADEFASLLAKHGWEDSYGWRNKVTLAPILEVEDMVCGSKDLLTSIPDWCFPATNDSDRSTGDVA